MMAAWAAEGQHGGQRRGNTQAAAKRKRTQEGMPECGISVNRVASG